MRKKLFLWLPAIFWMGLMFYLSSIPNLRVVQDNFWQGLISNGAHFGFYGLGYLLFFRALNFQKTPKSFLLPLILVSLYGISDEIHQLFVPTRMADVNDWLLDSGGALLAGLILKIPACRRGRKR